MICSKSEFIISGISNHVSNESSVPASQNVSEFLSLPIKQWNVDIICAWFEQMGLFMYIADVRRHLRAGNQLLEVKFFSCCGSISGLDFYLSLLETKILPYFISR